MLDRWVRRLEALASRGGDRISALMMSLTLHAVLLVGLAFAGHQVHQAVNSEFSGRLGAADAAPALDTAFQDIDQDESAPLASEAAGSFAPTLSTTITPAPGSAALQPASSSAGSTGPAFAFNRLDVERATQMVVPTASMLGGVVAIEGNGAEHVEGVEGAVDRIAFEIVRRLEQGRTLVVWAFDASRSLEAERGRLVKHIETIYKHIDQIDEDRLSTDGGLLTMVVSFGQGRKVEARPTADVSVVREAINGIQADESGVETPFTTVAEVVSRWGLYKDEQGASYRTMIVVVTDEVGDDEDRLEEAVALARKRKVPVYVLGSQAVFGRVMGAMDYYDPRTKHTYHNQPVRQGPESAMLERIHLPFWYDGPRYDVLEAGFGPYALSRMASATGGVYFVARMNGRRMGFDPARMREYKPDWDSRERYEAGVSASPLRQAVVNAATVTNELKIPHAPSLYFPSLEAPQFKEVLQDNQALAAQIAQVADEALGPITASAKFRDREVSRRWQAQYDLIRGRLLAMKVRAYEYNSAGARLVKDPPKFRDARSNAWRLVPDPTIQYSEKAAAAGREAESLLRKVVEEHPDTPWALLAARELKDPLGFKWVETYVPPPRQRDEGSEARRKNRDAPASKPPDPPKL